MKLSLVAVTILASLYLVGCNTVKGFGQDMQKGGQEIEKKAYKEQYR